MSNVVQLRSACPPIDIPESAWNELAWWANSTPKPQPPVLIPGLDTVNAVMLQAYHERLVAWKVGKAEALMRGLK